MKDLDDYRRDFLPDIASEDGTLDDLSFEVHAASEYPPGEHTHCRLCWATISNLDNPEYLKEGLYCRETHCWICRNCFNDFNEEFHWKLYNDTSRIVK